MEMRAAVLALSLMLAPWPAAAAETPPAAPAGTWEGFIIETPARRSLLTVALRQDGDGWQGTLDVSGARGLPLDAIRVDGADLHFELPAGDSRVVFDGRLEEGRLEGHGVESGLRFDFELRRLPDYPPPADRVEAWRQDLDVVRTRFMEYDRSFDPAARARLTKALDRLERALPSMDGPQVIVALSRAIALSGNAHTRLYLLRNRTELRRLPLRVQWFDDGLFVVRATPRYRDAVGCRVERVAGQRPRRLRGRVSRLFAGNAAWVDYKSPYFMTSPEILHGLGVLEDMEHVPFRLACPGREPSTLVLEPLPLARTREATEAWRDLSPLWHGDPEEWIGAGQLTESPPLYLRGPDRHYWSEVLQPEDVFYMQYNRSQDMPSGPGFAEFAADVEARLASHPPRAFVLDLRFNTGGDSGVAAPFLKRLVELERAGSIGRLFVVIGRASVSAGVSAAADLKQHGTATFVGEPIGDVLDTWSEGGNLVLPNSGLTVHFTNGFHSLSRVEHPELAPFLWSDLDLADLDPDVRVRTSSADYFSGRDPALDAILALLRR